MRAYFVLAGIGLIVACQQPSKTGQNQTSLFNRDSLIATIRILSADSFQGRKPATPGEPITIGYLKDKFTGLGLDPGNGTSYFQDVALANINAHADSSMTVDGPKGKTVLKAFDDYIIWTDRTEAAQSLNKTPVVFAGYGVVAPEAGWNDYAGLNVKGKVVMVLVNDPGFNAGDTTIFKGKTMTYYGRWTYKFEEAARQGARGCLIVHNTRAAGYPFNVQQASFNTSRLQLDSRSNPQPLCNVIGWVTDSTGRRLLSLAGENADALIRSADRKGFKGKELPIKLSTKMAVKVEYINSKNVLGKITGSKYPDETVVFTAHWDHLGIGMPDATGDSIYNGAIDNASGVAGMIELARAFKQLDPKPERSIVFLAVTSEEQGLLGSAYYVAHPVYPLDKTVADINIDGLSSRGRTRDLVSVGKGLSELEDLLKTEAGKQNRYLGSEDHPEAGYYYRSDHFNFAKAGVPSVHFDDGTDGVNVSREVIRKQLEDYTANHYHQPSDELTDSMTFEGGIENLKLYFELGKALAAGHVWPNWKPGTEFRQLRDKTQSVRQ